MKYPCLIPRAVCKTPIHAEVEPEDYGNMGKPLETAVFDGTCNYQDRAKTVLTKEKKTVEVTGCAYIPGDICPHMAVISGGNAIVYGESRRIASGRKARNPDGSVNYTVLELI